MVQTNEVGYLDWKKTENMSSEMSGIMRGSGLEIHPRMRLDFPPGGFLRPDASPAVGSSAGGASS